MKKRILNLIVFTTCFIFLQISNLTAAEADIFPSYTSIEPNVTFWKAIYSQYNSNQGLIHDNDDLKVVYQAIDLEPNRGRRSRSINRRRITGIKKKYAAILKKLAQNPKPETDEEKRVLDLFNENVQPAVLNAAAVNIRFQRGQRDRFINGVIRSGRYLSEIKKIFREQDLPEDLAYLPHVESSFNYNAYSKFGAAGIWQFTYRTGKRFMTVDYSVDERRDPIYASIAAAKLLKINYQILKSWPLALTAYNHGAKAMLRAKKKKSNYERIFKEYNGRRFKFASRNFYSEFLAAREIAKNFTAYFGPLNLDQPIHTIGFKTDGFVAVEDLASHFQIKKNDLQNLNLALRKPVFMGQKYVPKGFHLKLPNKTHIPDLVPTFPKELYKDKQKRSKFYYVRKGDVAGAIARRHGITLQDLIWANNLNRRARIYAGQNLRIPGPEDSLLLAAKFKKEEPAQIDSDLEEIKDIKKNIKNGIDKIDEQTVKTAQINPTVVSGNFLVRRTFSKKGKQFGTIQVETGETLGHYAEWLNVSAQHIRKLNQLSYKDQILMDRILVIPLTYISKETFEEQRYEYHKEFEEDFLSAFKIENVSHYTVKRGDNIWTICTEKLELPIWLVKKYNFNIDLNKLMPEQKITYPVVEKSDDDESYEKSE